MLDFSEEQIKKFQEWKEEFHDEISRRKKEQEEFYYTTLSKYYQMLCKLEKYIGAVEITGPSEVYTKSLGYINGIVDTKIKFGQVMERYTEKIISIAYNPNINDGHQSEVEKMCSFVTGKMIELRNLFDLFN